MNHECRALPRIALMFPAREINPDHRWPKHDPFFRVSVGQHVVFRRCGAAANRSARGAAIIYSNGIFSAPGCAKTIAAARCARFVVFRGKNNNRCSSIQSVISGSRLKCSTSEAAASLCLRCSATSKSVNSFGATAKERSTWGDVSRERCKMK